MEIDDVIDGIKKVQNVTQTPIQFCQTQITFDNNTILPSDSCTTSVSYTTIPVPRSYITRYLPTHTSNYILNYAYVRSYLFNQCTLVVVVFRKYTTHLIIDWIFSTK